MLGSTLVRQLARRPELAVRGTVRDTRALPDSFVADVGRLLTTGVDVTDAGSRRSAVADADVVVNAVGVIKQAPDVEDRKRTVELNALLPHQLAAECAANGSRLVHVSTDCVFSGRRGGYREADVPDPVDFYGRSKLLGEVEAPALTLRTSIVGHETQRHASLVDWFLRQSGTVRGFVHAMYSGITTHEFATMLAEIVLPRPELTGLYHVAAEPISKADLLALVAQQYGWSGAIEPFADFRIDRSLDARRFATATGYLPPSWPDMVRRMHDAAPPWTLHQMPAIPAT
jgi:dTDP-4-dehydrorhamnose reductase